MREQIFNGRRLIVLAAAVGLFGATLGLATLLLASLLFQPDDEQLVMWVTIASGVGAVIGGAFGQPLFSAGLDRLLINVVEPPLPAPEELDRWAQLLRDAVLRRRVRAPKSQREQMLRGKALMELAVTQDLNLHPGRGGRPHIRAGNGSEPFSRLSERWEATQGRLVILGEPGYGKTFAALALIDHVNKGDRRVAELFPLVEWHSWSAGRDEPAIEDWLVDQLTQTYPEMSKAAAMAMVMQGTLMPIFDGLDEVPESDRSQCRDALEAYAGRSAPFRPFVVTCRQDEYLALAPRWVGAERHVALVGLDGTEIASVLRTATEAPERWASVAAEAEDGNKQLVALLRSPLRLAAAIEVYESRDPNELREVAARPDAGEELWNRLLGVGGKTFEDADRQDVRRWLSFIAASMHSHDRQRFWLHELYLYVAPVDRHRYLQLCFSAFVLAQAVPLLLAGTYAGMLLAAFIATGFVFLYRYARDKPMAYPVREQASVTKYLKALPGSATIGVGVGLMAVAFLAPIVFGIYISSRMLAGLTVHFDASALAALQVAGFSGVFMAVLVFIYALSEVGESNVAEEPPASLVGRGPGAVIRATRNNALFAAFLGLALLAPLALLVSDPDARWRLVVLSVGLAAWGQGMDAWAFYHWSRWRLHRAGLIPRRLRRFLDWASEDTGWLRASDAYEFRHRELLDYLAREVKPVGVGNLSWAESASGTHDRRLSAQAQMRRGARLWRAEDFAAARDAYLQAVKLDPDNARPRRALAITYEKLGQPLDQLQEALAALEIDADSAEGHTTATIAYVRLGKPDIALDHARRALELDPQKVQYHANVSVILGILGRDREELEELDRSIALELPDDQVLKDLRAEADRRLQAQRAAVEAAEKAASERPEDPGAHWWLAKSLRQVTDGAGAEASRRRTVELCLQEPSRSPTFVWELSVRGYRDDALRLDEAIPLDRSDPSSLARHAQVLLEAGRKADSSEPLRTAKEIAVTSEALNAVANALMAGGHFLEAVGLAEKALAAEPENTVFSFTLVEALLGQEDLSRARPALVSALESAKRSGAAPGDPTWLCSLLWRNDEATSRRRTIEMLVEEYERFGFTTALAVGVVEATPVSPGQDDCDADRLTEWCHDWAQHLAMKRAVGILRTLSAQEE